MSGNKSSSYSPGRIDTILGAGVRIDGNIAFSGVLRNEGNIFGDVSCDGDANGTLVVGKAGNVSGTVRVAHAVVSGHVDGHVDVLESIKIQQGARVVGDISYGSIVMDAGGVIEGALTPRVQANRGRPEQDQAGRGGLPQASTVHRSPSMAQPPAGRSVRSGKTGWAKYGVALVLLIGLIAFVQLRGGPTPGVAPAAEEAIAPSVSVSVAPPTSAAPIESPVVVEPPKAATIDVVPAAPSAALNIETVASTAPSVVPNADLDQVVVVQGDSPAKSADFVFVTCGEPCLLQKKKREGPGEGTRVEVAQGARKRIAISSGEILRVARGQDVDIFYQGRKVAPRLVQTGVWMSFVPRSDDGTGK